jgi:hypothetical protein
MGHHLTCSFHRRCAATISHSQHCPSMMGIGDLHYLWPLFKDECIAPKTLCHETSESTRVRYVQLVQESQAQKCLSAAFALPLIPASLRQVVFSSAHVLFRFPLADAQSGGVVSRDLHERRVRGRDLQRVKRNGRRNRAYPTCGPSRSLPDIVCQLTLSLPFLGRFDGYQLGLPLDVVDGQ